MKRNMFFLTLFSGVLFAQAVVKQDLADVKQDLEVKQFAEKFQAGAGVGGFGSTAHPVLGSPYSATVVNESVQALADGTSIVPS